MIMMKMLAAVVLILVYSALQQTDGACQEGWEKIGPGCYKLMTTSFETLMTYSEALSSCRSIGGTIYVPNSEDEMKDVGDSSYVSNGMATVIGPSYMWVGCTDEATEGVFECEDGSQLTVGNGWWQTGEPNSKEPGGSSDDCAAQLPMQGLFDQQCNANSPGYYTLCEDISDVGTTTEAHPQTTHESTTALPSSTTRAHPQTHTAQTQESTITLSTTIQTIPLAPTVDVTQESTTTPITATDESGTSSQSPTTEAHPQTTHESTTALPSSTTRAHPQTHTAQTQESTITHSTTMQTIPLAHTVDGTQESTTIPIAATDNSGTSSQSPTTEAHPQTTHESTIALPSSTTRAHPQTQTSQTQESTITQSTTMQTFPLAHTVDGTQEPTIPIAATHRPTALHNQTSDPPLDSTSDLSQSTTPQAASQLAKPRFKSSVFSLAKNNKGRPLIGYCLSDHVMKTMPARSEILCAMACQNEVGCKSFNYRMGICELNEETREDVGSSFFSKYEGCKYYGP